MKSTYYFYYYKQKENVLKMNQIYYYNWRRHFENNSLKLSIQRKGLHSILIISNNPFHEKENILKCFNESFRPIFLKLFKKTTIEIDSSPITSDRHKIILPYISYMEIISEGYWTEEEIEQIKKLCKEKGEFWK